jgi:hypothetical protein
LAAVLAAVRVVARSQWVVDLGALGVTRTPNLLLRSHQGLSGVLDLHERRSQVSEGGRIRWLGMILSAHRDVGPMPGKTSASLSSISIRIVFAAAVARCRKSRT